MRLRPLALLIGLAAASWSSGCIAVRVATHYGTFSKLDPSARANIMHGRIEVGYTRAMVRLALGRPDSVKSSATEEVWSYSTSRQNPNNAVQDVASYVPANDNSMGPRLAPFPISSSPYPPVIVFGWVTFREGVVVQRSGDLASR